MNKQQIYHYLKAKNIEYEVTEHEAVFNMQEIQNIVLPYPDKEAKNIFVRDDKKRKYYLITVKGNKRVDLKKVRHDYNTRPLSFASPEELNTLLSLTPGSVTPLGLLNNTNNDIVFLIDKDFKNDIIGIHPNDNTATIWLKTEDLIMLIQNHGNEVKIIELS